MEKSVSKVIGNMAYFRIKNIRKWIICPSCRTEKMSFDKAKNIWKCKKCRYGFSEKFLLTKSNFWYCDNCEAFLNRQKNFDRQRIKNICSVCGYENVTSKKTVKGICSQCCNIYNGIHTSKCPTCKSIAYENIMFYAELIGGIGREISETASESLEREKMGYLNYDYDNDENIT